MNAIATFVTIMLPMTFKLAVDIIFWTLWKTKRTPNKPKWTFHLHFPLLTIHQNCQMVWRLALLLREKEQWMNDLEDINKEGNKAQKNQMRQLDVSPTSPPGSLIRMNKDEMENLINKLRGDNNFQSLTTILPRLQLNLPKLGDESFFDTNKYVWKSDAMQQLIEASLKLKLKEIWEKMLTF